MSNDARMDATDATPEPDTAVASDNGDNTAIHQGIRSLLGDEFSVIGAIGGVRGAIESTLPALVFVVVYVVYPHLTPALITAIATTLVLVIIRLISRTTVRQALSGLLGIAIGAIWAHYTHRAQDFYAYGLWVNAIEGAAFLISLFVRFPLVGAIVAAFSGKWQTWRKDKPFFRRSMWATLLWVGMFAVRLAVELPLYFGAKVGWLGTAKLALGTPVFVLVLWLSWLMLWPSRRAKDPHLNQQSEDSEERPDTVSR